MTTQTITLTPAELLPHKPPMLLLTSSGTADGERVTARCTVGEQCRLFQLPDGRYGTWMLIELMAQTVGIYAGLKNRATGSAPRIGFLLGTRKFNVHTQHLAEGDVIGLSDLHARISAAEVSAPTGKPLPGHEAKRLLAALERTAGNVREAAKLLGISRGGFYVKLKKLGLNPDEYR